MERVFLDANVLFSAGYKSTRLRLLGTLPDVILLSSDYAVREAELNLKQFRPEVAHLLTGDIKHFSHLFGVAIQGVLILSPAEYLKDKE
jgi:hypothetical protein